MGKKILIVEDEEFVIELLKVNLVRRGYEVQAAGSGEDALLVLEEWVPDLILLDIKLPGIDGWEVCRRLRENLLAESVSIIVLSAAAQKRDLEKARECSISVFIPKPFDMANLLSIITGLIG